MKYIVLSVLGSRYRRLRLPRKISISTMGTMKLSSQARKSRVVSTRRSRRRRRAVRRRLITILASGVAFLAAWIITGLILFDNPVVDPPTESDAVVVLAPATATGRLTYALGLMTAGYSATLVVSAPGDESSICGAHRPYRIICFRPDPVTTQGEARAIQELSRENGWRRITVVTDDSHVTRARILIARCYPYKLDMSAVRRKLSVSNWSLRFMYESAALMKAAFEPSC